MFRLSRLAIGVAFGLAGCSGTAPMPEQPEEVRSTEAPEPVEQAHPLRTALETAAEACEVDIDAKLLDCPESADGLVATAGREARMDALPILAEGLADEDPEIATIAALQLYRMSLHWELNPADVSREDGLALIEPIPTLPVALQRLAVTFVTKAAWPTSKDEARAMLDALEDPVAVARGQSAVLRYTRLRGLEPLIALADNSTEADVSAAVLTGMDDMGIPLPEEEEPLCSWATTQLDRDPAGGDGAPLFARAARVLDDCPDGTAILLAHTEARLAGHPLDVDHVRYWEGDCVRLQGETQSEKLTADQCRRVRAMLETTAEDPRATEGARTRASEALADG